MENVIGGRKEGRRAPRQREKEGEGRGITLGADLLHRRERGGKRGGRVDGVDAAKVMNTVST